MKTEHSGLRSESQSFAATGGQFNDSARSGTSGLGSSISESVARGKEAIGTAANEAINATGSDLVEPLAFLLSKAVKDPSVGNPVIDELIGNLRATAHGTTDEAISRAANVIRHGDKANLVVVLTGAALIGWLLSHHSRPESLRSAVPRPVRTRQ
jgi:hypothetical protein